MKFKPQEIIGVVLLFVGGAFSIKVAHLLGLHIIHYNGFGSDFYGQLFYLGDIVYTIVPFASLAAAIIYLTGQKQIGFFASFVPVGAWLISSGLWFIAMLLGGSNNFFEALKNVLLWWGSFDFFNFLSAGPTFITLLAAAGLFFLAKGNKQTQHNQFTPPSTFLPPTPPNHFG